MQFDKMHLNPSALSDFIDTSDAGKLDMFEEAHERMTEAENRVVELERTIAAVYSMMQKVRDEIPGEAYTAIIVIVPEWVNVWDRVQS